MTGESERLTVTSTNAMVESMATAVPDFESGKHLPSYLGHNAHGRLEDLFGVPIASDDANPNAVNEQLGQRAGAQLGGIVGRQVEFVRNLPKIEAKVAAIAEERAVPVTQVIDEMVEILSGSGIGKSMNRTLTHSLGDSYGTRQYIEENAEQSVIIVRENIANWGARRQDRMMSLLGSMSSKALHNVRLVVYAGSGRQYTGAELWRPELAPFVTDGEDGKVCSLNEMTAAEALHKPATESLLQSLGADQARVAVVGALEKGANADDVLRAVISKHGDELRDSLIIEVGNAPAGYVQLAGALLLQKELGIDAGRQFVATTDSVEIVRPDHFKALSAEAKSKVQNVETALNSFNGWLQTIVKVNEAVLTR